MMHETIKGVNMNATLKTTLKTEIENHGMTMMVSDRGTHIAIRNFVSGILAGKVYQTLDDIAKKYNLQHKRIRTFGNGMIKMADWEDIIQERA
jgi:hypothetical protein